MTNFSLKVSAMSIIYKITFYDILADLMSRR